MIDFHSHFFSRPFFETLAAQSPLPGTIDDKLASVADRTGLELPDKDVGAHYARWQKDWDAHGVDHVVSFASLPEEVPALVQAKALSNGRLTPFALVNPKVDGASGKVDALLGEMGFRGILLFPAMHHFYASDPDASAVLEVANAHAAVVVVHCGLLQVKLRDLLGLPRPFDFRFADPLLVVPAANRFRDATFVIPHFGAGMFRETLMAGSQCENVVVDTSSSNAWMSTQTVPTDLASVFHRALAVFGSRRIFFGTDSSTLPRGWRNDLCVAQREALDAAGADDAAKERIFDRNARERLGLA